MCLGILCKMCENVSSKRNDICVECEVAPLRLRKTHVIYNFLRRQGSLAPLETLSAAHKLLKRAKKNEIRHYDPDFFIFERITLRDIFDDKLRKLETDLS